MQIFLQLFLHNLLFFLHFLPLDRGFIPVISGSCRGLVRPRRYTHAESSREALGHPRSTRNTCRTDTTLSARYACGHGPLRPHANNRAGSRLLPTRRCRNDDAAHALSRKVYAPFDNPSPDGRVLPCDRSLMYGTPDCLPCRKSNE